MNNETGSIVIMCPNGVRLSGMCLSGVPRRWYYIPHCGRDVLVGRARARVPLGE